MTWTVAGLLGDATLTEVTGHPAGPGVTVEPIGYPFSSPATGALLRVRGPGWSAFVKVLHHVRHWALLPTLPPAIRAGFLDGFPWRGELDAWTPGFAARLPAGLRTPRLYRVVELGDDRLAVWMEDVTESPDGWDLPRYARAARLLGRFAARGSAPGVLAACPWPVGFAMRMWAERFLPTAGFGPLASDELWAHPRLAPHADLRETLLKLAAAVPPLMDRLDALPQAMPHGDASPQNLLVPADEPDTFVAIDISFQSPSPVGFDLGQLLVGLVHAGVQPVAGLAPIHAALLDGYLAGFADERCPVERAQVELGFVGSMLVRSGFASVPYREAGTAGPEFEERIALTRYLAEAAEPLL